MPENDQLLMARRAELRSKVMHDRAQISMPAMPPQPPAQIDKQVPPALVPPHRSLNRLKGQGLRNILEEKGLSTDGVVDQYPEVCNTIKFHKFEIFMNPRGSYIPTWVQEIYAEYGK